LEAIALNLSDSVFNFVLNLFPDDYLSNSHLRPFLARMFGLRCGRNCQIRKNIYFEARRNLIVGSNVFLNRQAYLDAVGGIRIGDNVRFGPQVMLVTGSHEVGTSDMRTGTLIHKPIVIGEGCWLGARVLITAGVTIGKGSVISAGSVVQRSMPADFLIAGNPARAISRLDKLGPAPDPQILT
jgi:acetyltransferase-like isoleucine patch superfamily enzyme